MACIRNETKDGRLPDGRIIINNYPGRPDWCGIMGVTIEKVVTRLRGFLLTQRDN